ncbi:MAG: PDZ domain-containing protein [Magnetococcales bacterium]|nr:PDZ domain-containing protein [Magnetococcales bacterium]
MAGNNSGTLAAGYPLAMAAALFLSWGASAQAAGWLGCNVGPAKGVEVREIYKESPADRLGLLRGDVILTLNGIELTDPWQMERLLAAAPAGSEATLSVMRAGQKLELKTKLEDGARRFAPQAPISPPEEKGGAPGVSAAPVQRGGMPGYGPTAPPVALGHTHDAAVRLESARSLLEAYDRIRLEKNAGAEAEKLSQHVALMLSQAQELLRLYRMDEGRSLLNEAYRTVKQELQKLRGGETLINPLRFQNKLDELTYERNRNGMYEMLVRSIPDFPNRISQGDPLFQSAMTLRQSAENASVQGDPESGVKLMEQSTSKLVRLLKEAGLDIPDETGMTP